MVDSYETLVFGASPNPDRYAYKAILMLRKFGVPVKAFGSRQGAFAEVNIDTNLKPYKNIHTVTLYLNPIYHFIYMNISNIQKKIILIYGFNFIPMKEYIKISLEIINKYGIMF